MESKQTFILFGSTNPYQAQCGRHCGFFGGATLAARQEPLDMTTAEASEWIMTEAEEDSGNFRDEETGILNAGSFDEVLPGAMSYHDDGYTWYLTTPEAMDEDEAKAAIHAGVWLSDEQWAKVYENHPDLAPAEETEH